MEEEQYQEYEEIDLRELFMKLWNDKWLIIAVMFIMVLFAGIYSFFIAEPVYESSSEILAPDFSLVNGRDVSSSEYISFLRTPDIRQKLIEQYDLDSTLTGINNKLKTSSSDKTNNIVLTLKDSDSSLSSELLNKWVSLFIADVENFINERNNNYIKDQEELMTDREESYLTAEKKLTEFEKSVNIDLLEERINTKTQRLVEFENRVLDLNNEITVLEEQNKLLGQQLQKTEKFIITNQTIDQDSMEVLSDILEDKNMQTLTTNKENINTVHTTLQSKKNQIETDLTGKEEELKVLKQDMDLISQEVKDLKQELADYREQHNLLKLRVAESKRNYQRSENDYNNSLQTLNKKDYQISVPSTAVVPEELVARNKKLNVAIAGMLGLFIGVFAVFVKDFFAKVKEEESKNTAQ